MGMTVLLLCAYTLVKPCVASHMVTPGKLLFISQNQGALQNGSRIIRAVTDSLFIFSCLRESETRMIRKCHHWSSRNVFSRCSDELCEDRWPLWGSFGTYFSHTVTEVAPVSWSRGSSDFCQFQSASGNWFIPEQQPQETTVRQMHLLKEHFLDSSGLLMYRCHFPTIHSDLGFYSMQYHLFPWTPCNAPYPHSVTHQPTSSSCQVRVGMVLHTRVFQSVKDVDRGVSCQ